MENLRNFNARNLYEKLGYSEEGFINWLKSLNLFKINCECNGLMSYKWTSNQNYPHWRCTRKSCRKEKGFLSDTFFEGIHLSLKVVCYD